MNHISNDPWAFDDFQRRVMLKLFSEREDEDTQRRNRIKRSALTTLLEGLYEDDRQKVSMAAATLREVTSERPLVEFDVVGGPESLS